MTDSTIRSVFRLLAAELGASVSITHEEKTQIRASLDEIYKYAKRNDMAHLIGYALVKNGLIDENDGSFELFETEQYTAMLRRERQDFELSRICKALESAEIDFIPLKGAVMRQYYPEPWMRTSCDIDVLVKKEDLARAEECMLQTLGYKKAKESLHDVSFDAAGSVHIELHFDLLEEDRAENSRAVALDVWDYTEDAQGKKHHKLLSDEMFYFYHVAHIAKHFEDGGIGVRPFLDLYLLNRDGGNEKKRVELLRRGGIEVFDCVARELSAFWFGSGELGSLGRRAEAFIFRCGAYGSMTNSILLAKEKTGGSRGYLLSRIFMPYDSIKYSYPILRRHKWLLPFCQVARWFKLLSPKYARRAAREVNASNRLTDSDYKSLKALMRDVGLE